MSSKVFTERLWEVDDLSKDELQKVVFALLNYMDLRAIRTNDTKHGDVQFVIEPEPTQDEPVDISDKSEPTIVAMLPNGVAVSNVYEAYEAGLKEGKLQDEEPVAWTCQDELNALGTDVTCYMYAEPLVGETNIPLYLHPATRPEFVRLSEEELRSCFTETNEAEPLAEGWPGLERFARAIEDALEEKNK